MLRFVFSLSLFIGFSIPGNSQSAEDIFNRYTTALESIDNIYYRIHNMDTFLSGTIWNKTGQCTLRRVDNNPISPFLFKGTNEDLNKINIFNGSEFYAINANTKTYTTKVKNLHIRGMLGSPGGQMILQEMILKIENYNNISYLETDSSFILKFQWPDNQEFQIKNRFMELHLNKETFLPFYRYHYLESFKERQVNVSYLTEMVVNNPNFKDNFLNTGFIDDYSRINEKLLENKITSLIDQTARDFELKDLKNNKFKLSDIKGKIILLDFWEIWCGPCLESVPKLKELQAKYPEDKFELWSIVSDSSTFSSVNKIVESKEINYRVLFWK